MNTREFFEQKMIHCFSVFHPKNHSRSSKTIFALVPKLFEVMRQNKIVALMDFLHSKPRKNELEASFLLFVRFWHVKIHNCKGWIDHFTFCRKVEKKSILNSILQCTKCIQFEIYLKSLILITCFIIEMTFLTKT